MIATILNLTGMLVGNQRDHIAIHRAKAQSVAENYFLFSCNPHKIWVLDDQVSTHETFGWQFIILMFCIPPCLSPAGLATTD